MVKHPHGVHTFFSRESALLPIDPPEINTFIFEWVMDLLKVGFEECSISRVEEDGLGN
jgi:hypothetical protein